MSFVRVAGEAEHEIVQSFGLHPTQSGAQVSFAFASIIYFELMGRRCGNRNKPERNQTAREGES